MKLAALALDASATYKLLGGVVESTFTPSTIRGCVVVFDKAGTPTCHYDDAAENNQMVITSRDAHDALYEDVERAMTEAIAAAIR